MFLVVWTDNNVLYAVTVREESLDVEYALTPYVNQIRALHLFHRDLFGNRYLVFRFQ